MVTKALFVRLRAKPGREAYVEAFLRGGLPTVEGERATTAWFALRISPSTSAMESSFHVTSSVSGA